MLIRFVWVLVCVILFFQSYKFYLSIVDRGFTRNYGRLYTRRRIIRLDELQQTFNLLFVSRIKTWRTHCLLKFVQTDKASSSNKTANVSKENDRVIFENKNKTSADEGGVGAGGAGWKMLGVSNKNGMSNFIFSPPTTLSTTISLFCSAAAD